MTLQRARILAVAFCLAGLAAAAQAQPVKADLRSVGFPCASASGYAVRYGQWFPIVVDLAANGTESIPVTLQFESSDLDGDIVSYTERPPPVPPVPGSRRVWLYGSLQTGRNSGEVRVVAADGVTLTTVDIPEPEPLPSGTMLVLDLSDPAVTLLQQIESADALSDEAGFGKRVFHRKVLLSRMPPAMLPDRWFGLEAVDVIVWDRPALDGAASSVSPAQLDALIQWVRQGGQLILGLGSSWPAVRASPLGELLDLSGGDASEEVDTLPFFLREYAFDPGVARFPSPIPLARLQTRSGLTLMHDQVGAAAPLPLITLHQVGSGRIITTAASLRDLSSVRLRGDHFLPRLIDLSRLSLGLIDLATAKPFEFESATRFLYSSVISRVEYRQLGSLLLLLALVFVFGYLLVSTFASWYYLQRRKRTDLAWPVFAGMSVVASLLSLAAVQSTRGCQSVRSISFVDLVADSTEASARVYLGYRSAGRQFDDLALPREPNQPESWLRPLAEPPSAVGRSSYATPARYEAQPTRGTLRDVLMRATLKQFEGSWRGPIEGTIRADLTARRGDGRITVESWLQNDLPVDFAGGVLLFIDPRARDPVSGGVPLRAGPLTAGYRWDYLGTAEVPPAAVVLAVPIGPWKSGQRLTALGAGVYEELDRRLSDWDRRSALSSDPLPAADRPEPPTLFRMQSEMWCAPFDPLRSLLAATPADLAGWLLISTQELYWPLARPDNMRSLGLPFSAAGLMKADVSHWLIRNQAVLLAWTDDPGPVRLLRDGRPMQTVGGASLYRVRIPLSYVGNPPPIDLGARTPAAPAGATENSP